MRYRPTSDLSDISRDVAIVIDFIGQHEYRESLAAIGRSLNAKGFVTPFDDQAFALELDLLNLEILRAKTGGSFQSLPEGCHAGLDFLWDWAKRYPTFQQMQEQDCWGVSERA